MKTTKLEKLNACMEAREWVKTRKSAVDAWTNCERGDWMLWLARKLDVDDRKFTLAKAMCVKQVEHLMRDQRSLDALEACFRYAKGEITREELDVFASNAYSAVSATTYSYAAYAASYAAYAASYSYSYSYSYEAAHYVAAYAYAYAYAYADVSRIESLKKSSDICREILTEEILEKYNAKK